MNTMKKIIEREMNTAMNTAVKHLPIELKDNQNYKNYLRKYAAFQIYADER